MIKQEKILAILSRLKPKPHYEIHFKDKVDFVTLGGKKLGSSKVEKVYFCTKCGKAYVKEQNESQCKYCNEEYKYSRK